MTQMYFHVACGAFRVTIREAVRHCHLQDQCLLLGLLQLLLDRIERAVQAASLRRQTHAALLRLQLLTLHLMGESGASLISCKLKL